MHSKELLMEIGKEKMKEYKEMPNLTDVSNSMSESCRCNELEERNKKAEMRCAELEFKLRKKDEQFEVLEAKLKALEDELEVLRVSSEELKEKSKVGNVKGRGVETILDLTDDNDEVAQLMIENSVLECEKKRAESEVEAWKEEYWKLESWASQLKLGSGSYYIEENGKKKESNTIRIDSSLHRDPIIDSSVGRARRQLTFGIEEVHSKKMAPSTPFVAKSSSIVVIDIIDSDDEPNIAQHPVVDSQDSRNICVSSCFAAQNEKLSSSYAQNNEEDSNSGEDLPFVVTPRRKRNCNVVTSESEGDDDDVTICKFKRIHVQEASPDQVKYDTNNSVTASISPDLKVTSIVTPMQRIMPMRKLAKKSKEAKTAYRSSKANKYQQSIPTNDDESQENLSDCEDGDSSDFIDDDLSCDDTSSKSRDVSKGDVDSDSGNSEDVQENDMDSDSQGVSDEDMDFSKILSQIHRRKDHMEWEFEADMLAAFGKDSELCMKAVCALYQQQTSEEQMSRGTLYSNQQGFSKFDAHRGSTLAEFLTHGDPRGGLKKTVKELQEYDPKAVELCRTLAIRYSKQLYHIYKNKDNPFFP